jgi:hypothetical protein
MTTDPNLRYTFDPKTIQKDRTASPVAQNPPSYDDMLKMMQGEMQIPNGSNTQTDLEAASTGETLLDNLWTPGDSYTDEQWRNDLNDQD